MKPKKDLPAKSGTRSRAADRSAAARSKGITGGVSAAGRGSSFPGTSARRSQGRQTLPNCYRCYDLRLFSGATLAFHIVMTGESR